LGIGLCANRKELNVSVFLDECAGPVNRVDGVQRGLARSASARVSAAAYARELALALDRHALRDRVEIVIGDSRTHALEPGSFDVVFADGDHSYEGVRADFEHWWPALADGGHMLFHDAVPASAGIVPPPREHTEGVERLVAEVVERSDVIRVPTEAGTIAHVVKRVVSDGERTGRRSPAAW